MMPVLPLLQLTWKLYKEQASLFLGYSAWILIPYIFIIVLRMSPVPSGPEMFLLVILTILQLLLIVWATTAITIVTFARTKKKNVKLSTLGRKAWSLAPPVILVALMTGLVVLGGTILLIVPGILFWVWYSFAQMEVILNKKRGWEALSTSHNLVRGRFWPVAWRLVGGPLFLLLCYFFIVAALVALIAFLTGSPEAAFATTEVPLWQEVLTSIVEMLTLPLFIIYATLLYLDVRSSRKP